MEEKGMGGILPEAMAMSAGGRSIQPVMVSSNRKNIAPRPNLLCHVISPRFVRFADDERERGAKE